MEILEVEEHMVVDWDGCAEPRIHIVMPLPPAEARSRGTYAGSGLRGADVVELRA
jgi:hypothetical protein